MSKILDLLRGVKPNSAAPNPPPMTEEPPGLDVLRAIAGYPSSVGSYGMETQRHRTMGIQRDGAGNVIGSIEWIDEDERRHAFVNFQNN
jgi:hypothetical protein